MAQQVVVNMMDDIDGGPAASTVRFALEGIEYDIDLSTVNAERLRASLAEFVEHGRRVRGKKKSGVGLSERERRARHVAIRTWANDNGYALSDRGRIPTAVIDEYDRAH